MNVFSKLKQNVPLVTTLIETVGLVAWLALVDGGLGLAGALVLLGALYFEHAVSFKGALVPARNSRILSLSVIETAVWVVWLLLATSVNPVVGVVFLFVGMLVLHTMEFNSWWGLSSFHNWKRLGKRIAFLTALEAVGGALWLGFVRAEAGVVGVVLLIVALYLEHQQQVKVLKEGSDEV